MTTISILLFAGLAMIGVFVLGFLLGARWCDNVWKTQRCTYCGTKLH
jgi:hypothetical protein